MILGKILNTNIKKGEQFKRKFLKNNVVLLDVLLIGFNSNEITETLELMKNRGPDFQGFEEIMWK